MKRKHIPEGTAEAGAMQSAPAAKYYREVLLDPGKLRKGVTRWNQFQNALEKIDPRLLAGPILDFGSGVGYFVCEGLHRKMNVWGVDILPGKIARYKKLIEFTGSPSGWQDRCLVACGDELPFAADRFAAVSSWYVFEHIQNPGRVVRDLVRVTRPGGVIAIRAQDARSGWEGHCKIPWIPFLPKRLEDAWLDAFGISADLRKGVYDITQPQVIAILEELDCVIVFKAADPLVLIENHWTLSTEDGIRRQARQVRAQLESGRWRPQPETLYVYARKKHEP